MPVLTPTQLTRKRVRQLAAHGLNGEEDCWQTFVGRGFDSATATVNIKTLIARGR